MEEGRKEMERWRTERAERETEREVLEQKANHFISLAALSISRNIFLFFFFLWSGK